MCRQRRRVQLDDTHRQTVRSRVVATIRSLARLEQRFAVVRSLDDAKRRDQETGRLRHVGPRVAEAGRLPPGEGSSTATPHAGQIRCAVGRPRRRRIHINLAIRAWHIGAVVPRPLRVNRGAPDD